MEKTNCWTFMQCGREPGGKNTAELGVCPAAANALPDGINGGVNGGRICWAVRGTMCWESLPGGSGDRHPKCGNCEFRRLVEEEEGAARLCDEAEVDFDMLPIRVNARVQIQTLEGRERRYYGRYVGSLPGRSVMIVTPDDLSVHEGERLIIRIFSGKFAYAFHTRLLCGYSKPSPYVHLAYPASVSAKRVRAAQRVRAGILGEAVRLGVGDANPVPVVVWDISTTGAAVEPERHLGVEGASVSMSFPLSFEEVESEIMVKGVLRNVRETVVGVEFDDMTTADRLLLHYFVDYRCAEG